MAATSAVVESGESVLLETGLQHKNKPVRVYLTPSRIIIEHSLQAKVHDSSQNPGPSTAELKCQIISLQEVVAVRTDDRSLGAERVHQATSSEKPCLLQGDRTLQSSSFSLSVIKRISKHRWRHKSCQFVCHDYGTCQIWIDKINDLLKNPEWKRPKRLLVFVNPYGGKKRAVRIFEEKVQPLFELAGIYSEVIVTKRQFHARDIIYEYDLQTVDGIVSVGGDGTFSEVLNGLIDRANSDAGIEQCFRHKPASPSLRIGIIPAGSTDAVAYSLVGINDPVTSALQIIIGDCVGMDVTALYKKEEFLKYTVAMSSYGYYGDLLKDSENLRWMGPRRYTWSGVKTFMTNRSYEGEISFLLASEEDSHPRDNSVCYAGCDKCRKAALKSEQELNRSDSSSRQIEFDLGSAGDVAAVSSKRANLMLKDGWHRVKGKFSAVSVVNISCRSNLSPLGLSPSSHLGDGCIDIILVHNCSRIQYLRHMVRIPDRKSDQFAFDFIQVYRVKEFSFQPSAEPEDMDVGEGEQRAGQRQGLVKTASSICLRSSVWNCDGELVEYPSLYIQVHCQLIKLFGRGVEEWSPQVPLQCLPCCSACDHDT